MHYGWPDGLHGWSGLSRDCPVAILISICLEITLVRRHRSSALSPQYGGDGSLRSTISDHTGTHHGTWEAGGSGEDETTNYFPQLFLS